MLNKVIMMGRLTADPELKTTEKDNLSVCNFSIAVERPRRKKGEEKETDFFNCTIWKGGAEVLCKYFKKGDLITISGSLRNSAYLDKNENRRIKTNIVVNEIYFTESKNKKAAVESGNSSQGESLDNDFERLTDFNPDDFEELDSETVPF